MKNQELLHNLLAAWEESYESGQPLTAQELCREHPELQAELEEKIQALKSMHSFLEITSASSGTQFFDSENPSSNVETLDQFETSKSSAIPSVRHVRIPGYEILEVLGRGGMGVVYKARDMRLDRIEALKMILAGSHSDESELARFQTEARSIAQIQHPNIVQIFEVGEHDGNPFLSLEYCDGGSLQEFLDGTPLQPQESARLVEVLARAMQAAHQKKIIHRDLKPANIMLAGNGEERPRSESAGSRLRLAGLTPKITDFGLAKQLDKDSGQTRTGAVIGTPSYMAPEQAGGDTYLISEATDIYSLGAVLYECLAGRPPFKAATPMDTAMQVISNEPVPPRQLQPAVPKDLETICLKCLQKDGRKRYGSALELAEDLHRFHNEEPILARPIGRLERLSRWRRKNPRVAALAGLLAIVIACSIGILSWLYVVAEGQRQEAVHQRTIADAAKVRAEEEKTRAETQKERAEKEAEKARKVADFLVGMFEASDPLGLKAYTFAMQSGSAKMTAREILDRGKDQVETRLKGQPLVQAATMDTIGAVYRSLGLYKDAEKLIQKAYDIRTDRLGAEHQDVAASLHHLGWLNHNLGRFPKAKKFYGEALAMRRKLLGNDHPSVTDTMFNLAWLHGWMSDYDKSEQMLRDILKRRLKQHRNKPHRETALAKAGLAAVLIDRRQYLQAVPLAKDAAETFLKLEGDNKLSHALVLFQRAVIDGYMLRDFKRSEKQFRQCLKMLESELGPVHPYAAVLQFQIGIALENQDRDAEAEKAYQKSLEIVRATVGLAHPKTTMLITNIAMLLNRQKKFQAANALFEELLTAQRRQFGKDHPIVGDALWRYSEVLADQDDDEGELRVLNEAAGIFRHSKEKYEINAARMPAILGILCRHYRRKGELDKAFDAAKERRELPAANADTLCDAGCELARLMADFATNRSLTKMERDRRVQRCKREALNAIRQAIEKGFKSTWRLTTDPRLTELSKCTEFAKLMQLLPPVDSSKFRMFRGRLTSQDPFDAVRKSSHHKVHTVNLDSGKSYQIDLRSFDFDTYLRIESAEGDRLAKNDDVKADVDLNSRLKFRPPVSGMYRIIATTFHRRATGWYSLVVRER